ncbi:MAG: RidA family protein [Dehalococcoidia bacterium]
MAHKRTNPDTNYKPTGFSHVVEATGSRIIYVSGQTPVDVNGEVVGKGDLAAQAEQVYKNIQNCLAAHGATFADVVKTTTLVVNYKPEDRPIIGAVRNKFYNADELPASTLIGVQALAAPDFMIEIEAVAVI